jgi:hypothetical protein
MHQISLLIIIFTLFVVCKIFRFGESSETKDEEIHGGCVEKGMIWLLGGNKSFRIRYFGQGSRITLDFCVVKKFWVKFKWEITLLFTWFIYKMGPPPAGAVGGEIGSASALVQRSLDLLVCHQRRSEKISRRELRSWFAWALSTVW